MLLLIKQILPSVKNKLLKNKPQTFTREIGETQYHAYKYESGQSLKFEQMRLPSNDFRTALRRSSLSNGLRFVSCLFVRDNDYLI